MKPILEIKNISKKYKLRGQESPYLTFRDAITSGFKHNKPKDEFWALNDVSFDVYPGESIGIIGRNGAGKSTLLKILSRITPPTKGEIISRGRIASLLEVGTGFHAELSGRENIFLNGSILGLTKQEIKKQFDAIVDFSGVEKFLDTPLKHYSSGMQLRLAFAVAAHLEPEILIIDEVLAVGDAEFQKKCLTKMGEVTSEGRTVLFVSHNMAAVQKLCSKGVFLNQGKVDFLGTMKETINNYLFKNETIASSFDFPIPMITNKGYCYRLEIEDEESNPIKELPIGQNWQVKVSFEILDPTISQFKIALGLINEYDIAIRTIYSEKTDIKRGKYLAIFKNDNIHFSRGSYKLVIGLSNNEQVIQYVDNDDCRLTISNVMNLEQNIKVIDASNVGFIVNQPKVIITKKS